MVDGRPLSHDALVAQLATRAGLEQAKDWDELRREANLGNIFHGLREGNFWEFLPSYKYVIGEQSIFRYVRLILRSITLTISS